MWEVSGSELDVGIDIDAIFLFGEFGQFGTGKFMQLKRIGIADGVVQISSSSRMARRCAVE
jgi:hypothetical protein